MSTNTVITAPRTLFEDNKTWFPVIDLAHSLVLPKGSLKTGAARWLKANLPAEEIATKRFKRTKSRRGGNLFCVSSDVVKVVGVYATHISNGGNFRARWVDLPDYPTFDNIAVRMEVAWRNIYKWSRNELQSRGGLTKDLVSEMRRMVILYQQLFGETPTGSWEETKQAVIEAKKTSRFTNRVGLHDTNDRHPT